MKMRRRTFDRFLVVVAIVMVVSVAVVLLATGKGSTGAPSDDVVSEGVNVNLNGLADVLYDRHLDPVGVSSSPVETYPARTTPEAKSEFTPTTTTVPTSAPEPPTDVVLTSSSAENVPEAQKDWMYCAAEGGLNIRKAPSDAAPIIGYLLYGQAAHVSPVDDEWVVTEDKNGVPVYLFRKYLSDTPPPSLTTTTANVWKRVDRYYYVTAKEGLNLRSAPDTDAEKVGVARCGGALHVVAMNESWSEIRFDDGRTVYAFNDFLTDVPPKTAPTTAVTTTKTTTKSTTTTTKTTTTTVNIHDGSPMLYSLSYLSYHGRIIWSGKSFTYYSQQQLPGYGLNIPGRHLNSSGYVADADGYIVLAANPQYHAKGAVITTPFGYTGKVYDTFYGSQNAFDVYIR